MDDKSRKVTEDVCNNNRKFNYKEEQFVALNLDRWTTALWLHSFFLCLSRLNSSSKTNY